MRRFLVNRYGNVSLIFGLSLPFMLLAAGGAVDVAFWLVSDARLQRTADGAALAGASKYPINRSATEATEIAKEFIKLYGVSVDSSNISISTQANELSVSLTATGKNYFLTSFGISPPTIAATAIASLPAQGGACVLTLDPSANDALELDSNAELNAAKCTIYVNSTNGSALSAYSNSEVTAASICVGGDYSGSASHYAPTPETGCPPLEDPMAAIPAPSVGSCSATNLEVDNAVATLSPGVYCGGITIKGDSNVKFSPGTFVIKDGKFHVDSNSVIKGEGVTFYLTGTDATIFFDSNVSVDLSAPISGVHAGILFFEDRSAPLLLEHKIFSNVVARLEGALYFPRGVLWFDSNSQIGVDSAFTMIVARRLRLDSNAKLVINADYDGSDVPVIGAASGSDGPRLVR